MEMLRGEAIEIIEGPKYAGRQTSMDVGRLGGFPGPE